MNDIERIARTEFIMSTEPGDWFKILSFTPTHWMPIPKLPETGK